mmetsp:Transcript_81451/g.244298  ORF Transcript_81451/g.244298 Transcript_81451/m.244298 type:complete len:522 (-) Transcript_81451:180-1745(-)
MAFEQRVHPANKGARLLQHKARTDERRLVQQLYGTADVDLCTPIVRAALRRRALRRRTLRRRALSRRVSRRVGVGHHPCSERSDNRVGRVELERAGRFHQARRLGVAQRLRAHDALHVGRPAVLRRRQHARRCCGPAREHHLCHAPCQPPLHLGAQAVERRSLLATRRRRGCILAGAWQGDALASDADKAAALVLRVRLDRILIDRIDEVQHLDPSLLERLHEGGGGRRLDALCSEVVDVLLLFGHPLDVLLQGRAHALATTRTGVETQQLRNLLPVLLVLVHAQLEVLREGAIEGRVLGIVLRQLVEQVERLAHHLLAQQPHQPRRLLQHLARDVKRQVVRVDDALEERKPLGAQLVAVVGDEDAPHIEPQAAPLARLVKDVKWRVLGHIEQALDTNLALHLKMLHREMGRPRVREALVELGVVVVGQLRRWLQPNGRLLVEHGPPHLWRRGRQLGRNVRFLCGHILDADTVRLVALRGGGGWRRRCRRRRRRARGVRARPRRRRRRHSARRRVRSWRRS